MQDSFYSSLAQRCAEAYRPLGRFAFGYVQGKLRHDVVYEQLIDRLPLPGPICDLGAGRGQTALLLALAEPELAVVGIDWDRNKVELAERAIQSPARQRIEFRQGDIRTLQPPSSGTVLMLDVLHYNPLEIQDAMLERAVAALQPGGHLYVREVNADGSWRARINILQERIGCFMGLNRGATLVFRSADSIEERLSELGLETRRFASWSGTPLANVLIEAVKPGVNQPPSTG